MTTANNRENNLSPWKPGQSGNPSGRPKGTRDLAGYVLETTDGGAEGHRDAARPRLRPVSLQRLE